MVKTLLVETGQIDTDMFRGVETPNKFFAPILDTRQVAKEIVRRIDEGDGGLIRMPAYAKAVAWYGILPAGVQRVVRWWSGIDTAMWKGADQNRSFKESETPDCGDGYLLEETKQPSEVSEDSIVVVDEG